MTVWLAIDDAAVENACMRFIPGSHWFGHLTYTLTENDDSNVLNQAVTGVERLGAPVDNELQAGEISIHSDLLVHGSEANRSARRRCGLTLRYCPADVRAGLGWNAKGGDRQRARSLRAIGRTRAGPTSIERPAMDAKGIINSIFGVRRALIGVIHVGALPGTPGSRQEVGEITEAAVAEACIYAGAGFHGLLIENTHDRPYLKCPAGPEIVAAMTAIGAEVRRAAGLPLGVQILAGANSAAMAVAHACGAKFVRVEGFVFAHVADEGMIESTAGELLRYRRAIGADRVRVFADIKKKHSAHAITADVDVAETARAAEFFLADGVIVSGIATGRPTDPDDVRAVSDAVSIPTLVGSGVTPENMASLADADALIVGSSVKEAGVWSNQLDGARVRAAVDAFLR